jgi:hypothetical protein
MRRSAGGLLATLVLSLAVWTFFYVVTPDPLTSSETVVVVGISAGVVYLSRWVWGFLRRLRGGNAQAS